MANEYGELEQLVNDVTSLDTARMTLRWALERLQNIEKEKADLKKNLTLAEETAKRLQVKEGSLKDAYVSRSKTLEEKEDFYNKLEATMSLLGEGKLDIQQLLKKEAKLDSLRHSLESEYSDKFEELDRNQRSVIERWNGRLLEVESQYAGRLAESQKKYDALRAELESDHQGRLTSLQASFKAREKDLSERIALLEGSVHQSEAKVENRRRELEAEYLSKKREAEENYRKLRNLLQEGFEEKLRAADSDHSAQITSLESSWQAERGRLLEEQRVREEQFLSAQARIKEIENGLAAQQEAHHSELLKMISEKEGAFRAQLAVLEKEKAAKEASVRELSAALEKRAAGWEAEKAALRADFDVRLSAMEAALREREAGLEKNYAARKEELSRISSAQRGGLEQELESRLAQERRELAAERGRMAEARERLEAAVSAASDKIKELENTISSLREVHRGELMERVSAAEASFREKLAAFEAERAAYGETINRMEAEARGRDAAAAGDRKRMDAEGAARASVYEQELAALAGRLETAAREAAQERENHGAEIGRISAESTGRFEERSAELKAGYEAMAARIKEDAAAAVEAFKASFAAAAGADRQNSDAERARLEKAFEEVSSQFRDAQVEIVALNAQLRQAAGESAARESAFTGEMIAAKAGFEKEISDRVREAVLAQTGALAGALEELQAEKASLTSALEGKESEITALKIETELAERNFEAKLFADSSKAAEARRLELEKAYASRQAALEEDYSARRATLDAELSMKSGRLAEENAALRTSFDKISSAAAAANGRAAELAEKLLAAEKDFHAEKLEMQKLYVRELDSAINSAVGAALETSTEKLRRTQEELEKNRTSVNELSQQLLAATKDFQTEKLEMQKEQVREFETVVSGAVNAAVEIAEQRLKHAQEELAKAQKEGREEVRLLEETYNAEKDRLMEEMDRRDRYIEAADVKVQELEREMAEYRQKASSELMRHISDQDDRFRRAAGEEKARSDARLAQLETLLSAKEQLLSEREKQYRQKQLELDSMNSDFNLRADQFNEEIFAQKRALADKEKALNDFRLKLEKDYSVKALELEQMKGEMTRAIMDYRKNK